MPLLEENTLPNKESANQATNPPPKEESSLLKTIGQLLPFASLVYEQFTGQKIPAMTGTMAEMQTTLIQISTNLQVVVQNQQILNQRITNLENSANNLTHQFKNLRLTHTKEQKQIEYGSNQQLENAEENY